MVCGKHKRSFVVIVKLVYELCDFLHTLVYDLYVVQIGLGVRSVCVTGGVEAKQMQEEDILVFAQFCVERRVVRRPFEQLLYLVKDPQVQVYGVLRKVLCFRAVAVGIDPARDSALFEHWQDVGAAPAPGVAAAVEDAVEIDRVELPAGGDGGHVLIQAGYESNVAGPRLGGNAGVGDAKSAMFENTRTKKGSEWPRDQSVCVVLCARRGVGE